MPAEIPPLYSVYRAGAKSIRCFRGVMTEPATVSDFLSHLDHGLQFEWWDIHRAIVDLVDERYLAEQSAAHAQPV